MLVSYAQNLEDVILMRALKSIDRGFYIDVGAAWPDEHSVTRAFYDKGWSGINVEPNPKLLTRLVQARPRDINLGIALGASEAVLQMHIFEETGISTLVEAIAEKNITNGLDAVTQETKVSTLSALWKEYVGNNQSVHFLKIDVEGFEKSVLTGNDWRVNRPWVVVVEATVPGTQEESHYQWESILTSSKYNFVYADGLNRFYLADERNDLLREFQYPPNVFDGYRLSSQVLLENRLELALAKIQGLELEVGRLKKQLSVEKVVADDGALLMHYKEVNITDTQQNGDILHQKKQGSLEAVATDNSTDSANRIDPRIEAFENRAIRAEFDALKMRQSLSWRITYPLRRLLDLVVYAQFVAAKFGFRIFAAIRKIVRAPISGTIHLVLSSPSVSGWINKLTSLVPPLNRRLAEIAIKHRYSPALKSGDLDFPVPVPKLTMNTRAKQVYEDLCALKNNQRAF